MTDLRIEPIARQNATTQMALLALNNAHARETSFLTPDNWQALIDGAFVASCAGGSAALLIAFDQAARYDNPNFNWFRERLPRFVYVDRIVVADTHRGGGLARLLYRDLFHRARSAGQDRIACEVNLAPPNPASDAFHTKMEFAEIGRATLVHSGKTVRYLARRLT